MLNLTLGLWLLICSINTTINEKIIYENDLAHYGKIDYWTYPYDNKGDCEDIAIAKQKELLKHGIKSKLATGWYKKNSAYHLVLIVETDYGSFVLDNISKFVKHVEYAEYRWDKIEGENGKWYRILL